MPEFPSQVKRKVKSKLKIALLNTVHLQQLLYADIVTRKYNWGCLCALEKMKEQMALIKSSPIEFCAGMEFYS